MQFLKKIFASVDSVLSFINKYFKAMLLLLIIYMVFFTGDSKQLKTPNLIEISLENQIINEKDILEKIYAAQEDENIKGVLLSIDSPGGALSPSVEISLAVKELNSKKPVVAYAKGTMASGSYLSGVWASKIYANPGSFIGSIGVIMQGGNISELMNKIGVSEQTVSAGEYKQAGTITRQWTQKERESLQTLVSKSYELFINEVATARNLDLKKADLWANARVFLAADAQKLGLIDKVANYQEAKELTKQISGVEEPIWKKAPLFEKMFDKFATKSANMLLKAILPSALSAK